MNKKISGLLLSLLLTSSIVYAKTGNVPDAPEADYTTSNSIPEQGDDNVSLVGDDPLNEDTFQRGDHYDINLGKQTIWTKVGDNGQTYQVDKDGYIIVKEEGETQEANLSTEYKKNIKFMKADYKTTKAYREGTEEERETIRQKHRAESKAAKIRKVEELERKNYSQKNNEALFIKGLQSAGKGGGIAGKMLNHKENETEAEANVTNFYQQNYTSRPYHNSTLKLRESNAAILVEAYDKVDDIEAEAKAHLDATSIRCYISRDLIPQFYCPISGKQDIMYPDFSGGTEGAKLLSSEEAEKKCNSDCRTKQLCKSKNILSNTEKEFTSLSGKKVYPTREQSTGIYELNVDDRVATRELKFTFTVHPSENFDGNATEFDYFLKNNGKKLKVKYGVLNRPTDPRLLPELIVNKPVQILDRSKIEITVPIFRQTDRLILQSYIPYVYAANVWSYQRQGEEEFLDKIGTVTLDDIKIKYNGDSLFYCPTRQFVPNLTKCDKEVKNLTINSQLYNLCLDSEHMIGEDRNTGGFFTQESCENACYDVMPCKPTYKHYTDLSNKAELFKANVGCVEENTNIGCQDEVCLELFKREGLMPQEELVVQTDNVRVETVKNYKTTKESRPKIDIEGELSNLTESEYTDLFKKEMKDAAYKSMIENQTFNRIKYKIGEISPEQKGHIKTRTPLGTQIRARLKPASNKFDNEVAYSVYSVMKYQEFFPAKYGKYTRPGYDGNPSKVVDASKDVVIFKDEVYLIKSNTNWLVFKQILTKYMKVNSPYIQCPAEQPKKYDGDPDDPKLSQEEKDKGCYIQKKIDWIQLPSYQKDNNVKYNEGLQRFESYSTSEQAPYLIKEKFYSDRAIKEYDIVQSIEKVADETPGCMIRDQITEDLGISLTRVFDTTKPYVGANRGRIGNVEIYLFSGINLSYQHIIDNELTEENKIFDYINQTQSRKVIYNDGELENKIEPYILGVPEKSTLDVKIIPRLDEEHKRVFKFIFLFNESADPDGH